MACWTLLWSPWSLSWALGWSTTWPGWWPAGPCCRAPGPCPGLVHCLARLMALWTLCCWAPCTCPGPWVGPLLCQVDGPLDPMLLSPWSLSWALGWSTTWPGWWPSAPCYEVPVPCPGRHPGPCRGPRAGPASPWQPGLSGWEDCHQLCQARHHRATSTTSILKTSHV